MSSPSPNHLPTDDLERRIVLLRRSYGRGFGRKPTLQEEAAMARAARLTARAEIAARDPTVGLNNLVRIDGAAARARSDMFKMLEAGRSASDDYDVEVAGMIGA